MPLIYIYNMKIFSMYYIPEMVNVVYELTQSS